MSDISRKCRENSFTRFSVILQTNTSPENRRNRPCNQWVKRNTPPYVPDCSLRHIRPILNVIRTQWSVFFRNVAERHGHPEKSSIQRVKRNMPKMLFRLKINIWIYLLHNDAVFDYICGWTQYRSKCALCVEGFVKLHEMHFSKWTCWYQLYWKCIENLKIVFIVSPIIYCFYLWYVKGWNLAYHTGTFVHSPHVLILVQCVSRDISHSKTMGHV